MPSRRGRSSGTGYDPWLIGINYLYCLLSQQSMLNLSQNLGQILTPAGASRFVSLEDIHEKIRDPYSHCAGSRHGHPGSGRGAEAAPIAIGTCQNITTPGSYVLGRNLSTTGNCLVVRRQSGYDQSCRFFRSSVPLAYNREEPQQAPSRCHRPQRPGRLIV
jgi:hypothetical protein